MATTPIARSQSRLDLIFVEAEDKVALNGLVWELERAGDSLVVMVPGVRLARHGIRRMITRLLPTH